MAHYCQGGDAMSLDISQLVANYGAITAIAVYLVHYVTTKQNGKLDKIADKLEKIIVQQQKIIDKLEELLRDKRNT